jgi:hypothetical protein
MMKQRSELAKENKAQNDFTKRIAKIQAGLQAGNVPPELVQQWMADNGPLDEDNVSKAENDFALFQSQVKAQEKADKDQKTRIDLFGRVAKGTLPASAVKNLYKNDPEAAATADTLEKQFKDMYTLNLKVKQERAEQLKQAGRLAAKMGDAAKEALSNYKEDTGVIDKEVDDLLDTLKDPDKVIQYAIAQSLTSEGGEIDFKKAGQEILAKVEGLRAQRAAIGNQRFKTAGGKGALPKPEPVVTEPKEGDPGPDDEALYKELQVYGAAVADAMWQSRFGKPHGK